ncbi:MAG: nucleotide exchange factor GrpE [Planctomycetota bacterium]|nr:MAG: nucleotide exchange factor GrpE [Planctomycetota bacterium]
MMSRTPGKKKEPQQANLSGDAADKKIAELEEQLKTITDEKQDLFEKFQRVSADYINYQKRTPRQIADSVAYEKKAIIRSILPTLDNLVHAIAGAREHNADESVVKGIEMVHDHMLDALKAHGVKRIVALGEQFDPVVHEAVMQRSEEDKPDNYVLEEYQNGYMLNDRVIRPAKVIVNKLPQKEAQEQTPDRQVDLEA